MGKLGRRGGVRDVGASRRGDDGAGDVEEARGGVGPRPQMGRAWNHGRGIQDAEHRVPFGQRVVQALEHENDRGVRGGRVGRVLEALQRRRVDRFARQIDGAHDGHVEFVVSKRTQSEVESAIAREFLGRHREAGASRVPLTGQPVGHDVRHGADNAGGLKHAYGLGGDGLFEEERPPAQAVAGHFGVAAHADKNAGALGRDRARGHGLLSRGEQKGLL